MYTYIPLRFENEEVKLGSATWSLDAALGKALATNSNTAKIPQTELSAKTTERQEKKNGRPQSRHWGFCPLSPSRPSVLVRLAYDGRRWIGGQSRIETKQWEGSLCHCGSNGPFPSKLFLYCPFNIHLSSTDIKQEPADNLTKS